MIKRHKEIWPLIWELSKREFRCYMRRPLLLFCLFGAPLLCIAFFTTLMWGGLPTNVPAAVVDEDNTQVTRTFIRTIDAFQQTDIVAHYHNFSDARQAMQRGEIHAIFYIPKGLTEDAVSNRQPHISFYTNEAYFIPSTLLMKDLRMASEMLGISLTRESLTGRGVSSDQVMGILQPIVIEKHALGNPLLNYSVYLTNIILPGLFFILVMLCSSYVIGEEWKRNSQRELYQMCDYSQTTALAGKLLPITIIFSLMFLLTDVYLYKVLGFPCKSGVFPMFVTGVLGTLASQGIAILIFGIFVGQMRFSMSICSLWGILGISMSGFTFPVSAMHPILQYLSNLFPLRHYFLIYCNQALNGYPIGYVWFNVFMLFVFMIAPFVVMHRYRYAFLKGKYKA